ncbi:MAG TPA: NTP transferase domain-containing protein [Marmoricola sp.]|nr:NTP transferase domain-containing protein [Marmoricola sp.]
MEAHGFGGVVLSGGGAARLGGADKATIEIGDRTLLEHALAALGDATEVVVVGDQVPTSRPVTFAREDPRGGGPVAGLLAGIGAFARTPALVVALAVDMPLVTSDTISRLVAAVHDDGATLVDAEGRTQYLCAAYSVAALDRARAALDDRSGHGVPMRRFVAGLRLAEVDDADDEAHDVDTWDDLVEVRRRIDGRDRS